jgi:hypothetical protein
MTDDRLAQFRSEVSLPDEATAEQIYAHATSVRRRHERRWIALAVVAAALGAALGAAALGGAFRGGVARARRG